MVYFQSKLGRERLGIFEVMQFYADPALVPVSPPPDQKIEYLGAPDRGAHPLLSRAKPTECIAGSRV